MARRQKPGAVATPMKLVEVMDHLRNEEFQQLSPTARRWLNEATTVYNLRKTPMPALSDDVGSELISVQGRLSLWNRSHYELDPEEKPENRDGIFHHRRRDRALVESASIGRTRINRVP
jgi:hypothetical protein